MGDEIQTGGGAAMGDAHTRDFTARDSSQQHTGSSVTFQNPDSAELWRAIITVSNQLSELQARLNDKINDVAFKLDDLPNRVNKLEVKVDPVPVPIPVVGVPMSPAAFGLLIAFVGIVASILLFFLGRTF